MMPYTINDKPVTAATLIEFNDNQLIDYHEDEIEEPYPDAGFCICFICQEVRPRFLSASEEIERLNRENDRLSTTLRDANETILSVAQLINHNPDGDVQDAYDLIVHYNDLYLYEQKDGE